MKKVRRTRVRVVTRAAPAARAPAHPFAQHSFEKKIEFIGGDLPTVYMTREVYSRIWHYVDIADEEVGWYGTVKVTQYGNYLIDNVFMGEQEVSATQTEISTEGLAKIGQEILDTRSDGIELVNRLFFWGHSHVRMGVFASGQDDKQMDEFRENECPWFVRGIFNKLGRIRFDIFLYQAGVKLTDVPWAIYEHVDESIRADIEKEMKAKVKRKVYKPYKYKGPKSGVVTLWQHPGNNGGPAVDQAGFDTMDSRPYVVMGGPAMQSPADAAGDDYVG